MVFEGDAALPQRVEEIRVLKDMATIDLLSLNDTSLKREFEQLKKLKERFKSIWTKNGWPNRKAWNKLNMSREKV